MENETIACWWHEAIKGIRTDFLAVSCHKRVVVVFSFPAVYVPTER